MFNRQPKIQSVAWAWAIGWSLVSMGMVISDVYSSPNRGLIAYYVLGVTGWIIGVVGTIRYMRHMFGVDVHMIALSVTGWGVGALVAMVLGLFWMETWNLGFLGSPVGVALGAAIGGALMLPRGSQTSFVRIIRVSSVGAFSWGAAFLVFQILAFYVGYFLMLMTYNPLASMVGWVWATVPGWTLPAGFFGFIAAWLAIKSLHITWYAED
ncbi:MAG: hypothetical protein A2Z71_05790 [Chloroflexi bacterium RBG_13_50_21]|nr:MAG: hypothetical protein A2Z71_05790 [Chloroflexi bacterium RBG_13_50_21]